VDDFSRKTWIYFLRKKDEVFKWFRSFKALVENQTRKKIKILRTDNGPEYESNELPLRGRPLLHILLNKMVLSKGHIELS